MSVKQDVQILLTDSIVHSKTAVIRGKILNREVYPDLRSLRLTIPGFKGDITEFLADIDSLGNFRIEFSPDTKREISLYPVEDVLVISPGDSLFIVKDFKDIASTQFSGNGAATNEAISKFRYRYLGIYPSNQKSSYNTFKAQCDTELANNYKKFSLFCKTNRVTEDFKDWAKKQIELDYYNALASYLKLHAFLPEGKDIFSKNNLKIFDDLDLVFDNKIVMADYYKFCRQSADILLYNFHKEARENGISEKPEDSKMMESVFSFSGGNYKAQFTLYAVLSNTLNAHSLNMIDKNADIIKSRIKDQFLLQALQIRYLRVKEYLNNPKPVSDAILNGGDIKSGNLYSPSGNNKSSILKNLIKENRGKVIYIDLWSAWCPPCIILMKCAERIKPVYAGKDLVFAYISINTNEDLWKKSLEKLKISGVHIYCNEAESREISKPFKLNSVPYYLLINREGIIVDYGRHLDPSNPDLIKKINTLLNN